MLLFQMYFKCNNLSNKSINQSIKTKSNNVFQNSGNKFILAYLFSLSPKLYLSNHIQSNIFNLFKKQSKIIF